MLNKDNERELAYIVKVTDVFPMEADRLERVMINGWAVVCAKGAFKKDDLGVFFEIDSQLPEVEPFNKIEFLKSKHYKIKSQKIRGVVSQGLLLPLSDFNFNHEVKEGDFLTRELGVTYYIKEDNRRKASNLQSKDKYKRMASVHAKLFKLSFFRWLMKRQWGKDLLYLFLGHQKYIPTDFPNHFEYIKKTDEERVENMPWILSVVDNNGKKETWVKTTKIDGTSATYILEKKRFGYEFYVTSRNVRQIDDNQTNYHTTNGSSSNVYWDMAKKYNIKECLQDLIDKENLAYACIQGEIVGPSIQGNPHQLSEVQFFAFNYIDSVNGRYNSVKAKNILKEYNINFVPIVDKEYTLPDDLEEFKLSADGPCELPGAKGLREGYVYRSQDGKRSFKNVSRQYLLKYQ